MEPVRTGIWTTGVASLPPSERFRWLRASSARRRNQKRGRLEAGVPEGDAWQQTLEQFRALGLVSEAEIEEALSLLDPAFPFFAAMRMADSVHLHVKVDDVDDLPFSKILALGTQRRERSARLCEVSVPGRHQPDLLLHSDRGRRSVVRSAAAETVRRSFRNRSAPRDGHRARALRGHAGRGPARRLACKSQGGGGRPVFCCHSMVAEKYWVYPPPEGSRWTRPLEFAYGPLRSARR